MLCNLIFCNKLDHLSFFSVISCEDRKAVWRRRMVSLVSILLDFLSPTMEVFGRRSGGCIIRVCTIKHNKLCSKLVCFAKMVCLLLTIKKTPATEISLHLQLCNAYSTGPGLVWNGPGYVKASAVHSFEKHNLDASLNSGKVPAENTNWGWRLSTVDLLIKIGCFIKVSIRRSTILSLPLQ